MNLHLTNCRNHKDAIKTLTRYSTITQQNLVNVIGIVESNIVSRKRHDLSDFRGSMARHLQRTKRPLRIQAFPPHFIRFAKFDLISMFTSSVKSTHQWQQACSVKMVVSVGHFLMF
jgi:hypothetical protein